MDKIMQKKLRQTMARASNTEINEILDAQGVDFNKKNGNGTTMLMFAARNGLTI